MTTDTAHLYLLQSWLSPSFPVGAYTYSHGLETLVDGGEIASADELGRWLEGILTWGAGHTDAVLLIRAMREVDDPAALATLVELAAALAPSSERELETLAQGRAFLDAVRGAWPAAALDALLEMDQRPAYPVAVGVAAAAHGIPEALVVPAYLHALISNLISAGVRLIPLGQSDGQALVAAFAPRVEAAALRAIDASTDATLAGVGGCALAADIASMQHETLYSRLFRS